MTMGYSQEYVNKELQSADEALGDGNYLLLDARLKAAANRAYYAMFHAVQAAIATAGVKTPKTHGGAMNLFGRYFIATGKLDRRLAKDLQDAYDLRQMSDYGTGAQVGADEAKEALDKAEAFVTAVKRALAIQ